MGAPSWLIIWIFCGMTSRGTALHDAAGEQQQHREYFSNYNVPPNALFLEGDTLEDTPQNPMKGSANKSRARIRHYEDKIDTAEHIRSELEINERGRSRRRVLLSRGRGENQDQGGGGGDSGTGGVNNNNNSAENYLPGNPLPAAGGGNNGYGDYGAYMADAATAAGGTPPSSGMMGYDPSSVTNNYRGDDGTSFNSGNTNDYSSVWGAGAASSATTAASSSSTAASPSWQSWFKSRLGPRTKDHTKPSSSFNIFLAIFLFSSVTFCGMLATAHHMEYNPEGTFANFCRLSLHTFHCLWGVIYNLYHCRLGEVAHVAFSTELEEDEYTDEEIEHMRLRPGIEKALDVEHRKALRKVGIEMNKIRAGSNNNNKKGRGVPSTRSIQQ